MKKPKLYVVFYMEPEFLYVKVGRSVNVHKRVKGFQNPFKISFCNAVALNTVNQSALWESYLIKILSKWHLRREWFRVDAKKQKEMDELTDIMYNTLDMIEKLYGNEWYTVKFKDYKKRFKK